MSISRSASTPADERLVVSRATSSLALRFVVKRKPAPAPVPVFLDADASGTILLPPLPGPDTRVAVSTANLEAGDEVLLKWRFTSSTGGAVTGELHLPVVSPGQDLIFQVPDNNSVTLVPGMLEASVVLPDGTTSDTAHATLARRALLEFGDDHWQEAAASYIIVEGRPPRQPAPGANATYVRQATGGIAPYTYQSSDTSVATVDQNGQVVAAGNGASSIIVTDRMGQQASYTIIFSGVRTVERFDDCWWTAIGKPERPDRLGLTRQQMNDFWTQYKDEVPNRSVPLILGWPNSPYWTSDNISNAPNAWAVDLNSVQPNFSGQSTSGGVRLPAIYRQGW
ncbi:Ig-like domain-containing protein [Pseudomonas sichuanensis]|uniref:Ig-like domain-containing protein n=1 Tax=Pseudomonas sichuanensis TaxID=2213015 RepID=UPI00216013B8|nr:Ig-like domain-containing protein [Pseudomonas sichuanensis]UVK83477.1 Ig-like domain-containing protein [Pseudomonas sichuanensis]